jgi:peptidoglycan/LPS O-acetylase OafA/YrhL
MPTLSLEGRVPSVEESIRATARRIGFWAVSLSVLVLVGISWINKSIVGRINLHIFHMEVTANPGWWVYTILRTIATGLVVWTIYRFPEHKEAKAAPKSKEGKLFDPLMGLRAMACMMVLLGHFFFIFFPFSTTRAPALLQMSLVGSPWAAVWLFFTLSGYLMGKGFMRGRYTLDEAGCRLFFRNRMLRIGPVYYASIFFLSIYRYPEVLQWKHGWILLEMAVFDYRICPINPNGILWSISTEMQFYLLAPLMILFLLYAKGKTGRGFFLVPIFFLCANTALRMWVKQHLGWEQMFTYGYAPLVPNLAIFLAGMSINLLPKVKISHRWLGPAIFAGSVGFYLSMSCLVFYKDYFHMDYADLQARVPILCVLMAAALIYLAELRGRIVIRKGLVGWFLIALQGMGTLTYCLYVFHPEIFFINSGLPTITPLKVGLPHFPLTMLETFLVASFFYFAVEKPFDLKKRVGGTALTDAP